MIKLSMVKKLGVYFFGLVLGGLILVWDIRKGMGVISKNDFRIGIFSEEGVSLVAVSPNRQMVNMIKIEPEVFVWVPEGYSWYKADKLGKLLEQEKRRDLGKDILFYNFGFRPDKIFWLSTTTKWESWGSLISKLGFVPSIVMRQKMDKLFFKEDIINGQLQDNLTLDELISRQLSDNELIEEGVRLSVYNGSGLNGLASFVADRLRWAGWPVLTVGDWPSETEGCQILYSKDTQNRKTITVLKDIFDKCSTEVNTNLLIDEVEIILGRNWAEMVEYSSYVRTF